MRRSSLSRWAWAAVFFVATVVVLNRSFPLYPALRSLADGRGPSSTASTAQSTFPVTAVRLQGNPPRPHVDLGYTEYAGIYDGNASLYIFKGIRYAKAPVGHLRWQQPQAPEVNRSVVIKATEDPLSCLQTIPFLGFGVPQSEDCLFLNVRAPVNASSLPVFVFIHGGAYVMGGALSDPTMLQAANDNGFVAVDIQYRLGAFGFLASDEVHRRGVENAGVYDAMFALHWVQKYIHLFGGDPSRVTVGGGSAGAGIVMLLAMANGGTLGDSLFVNAFAASPYLPKQHRHNDTEPSQSYLSFAKHSGCVPNSTFANSSQTVFDCLVSKDADTLIEASRAVVLSESLGLASFTPVTDGTLIQQRPSYQLSQKQVNGQRILVGSSSNEGRDFTPQNITTQNHLVTWLRRTFPRFHDDDIAMVLETYAHSDQSTNRTRGLMYCTDGYGEPTAVNMSCVARGQQQRANNIFAETSFICPTYWLAEAFSTGDRSAFKYQYSVPPGLHTQDISAFLGPPAPNQGPDFVNAFMKMVGNFIISNNPSVPKEVANGASADDPTASNPASDWPPYSVAAPYQLNLNQSGGTRAVAGVLQGGMPWMVGSSLRNNITLANADDWEGGRGRRCDFWRSMGELVPE